MKVRYTRRARDDLASILDYIDERNPSGALNVKRAIRKTIDPSVVRMSGSRLSPG